MSRVQIILTPSGERLAILPAEDYEALVAGGADAIEDAADLARIDEILGTRDRGAVLPAAAMKQILSGESPLRVWREFRGLSQSALAKSAGILPSYLSMIETGKRVGPVATLRRIAKVLDVDLDDLLTA
jgi:DNA-binding XRE family transcriptional regulator